MRTLRVFESLSVDGYFADAQDDMRWAHDDGQDPEFAAWVSDNAGSGGALVFGRKTYEMMAAFWPTALAAKQLPEVAAGMNAATKYVATRTLEPTWHNAQRLQGELVDTIGALKREAGPDLVVLGSGSIAAQLGSAGLVDEYLFAVVPIALGEGRRVFAHRQSLRLVEQRAFPGGRIVVRYGT